MHVNDKRHVHNPLKVVSENQQVSKRTLVTRGDQYKTVGGGPGPPIRRLLTNEAGVVRQTAKTNTFCLGRSNFGVK